MKSVCQHKVKNLQVTVLIFWLQAEIRKNLWKFHEKNQIDIIKEEIVLYVLVHVLQKVVDTYAQSHEVLSIMLQVPLSHALINQSKLE